MDNTVKQMRDILSDHGLKARSNTKSELLATIKRWRLESELPGYIMPTDGITWRMVFAAPRGYQV